ncbi:unnamed protein product [Polarella glacialis]|uniref:MYND-type domain-containing protein n=1 Tax=Polarella glacialis TaxID=89957 RepID=A0A813LH00_POLGL|nr:unnamed protein product [Polarella glacialis]
MNFVILAIAYVAERRFQLDPNTMWAAELCIVGKYAKLKSMEAPVAVSVLDTLDYTFGALLEDLDRLSHEEFQPASRHVKKLMRSMALPDNSRMSMVSCGYCGEVGEGSCSMSKCLGCEVVRYCGTECQKDHWPVHKKLCKHLKRRRQYSDEAARAALEPYQENKSSS